MDNGRASVLVADDDPMMRLLARKALEWDGFAVMAADNGEEALQMVATTGCDLILGCKYGQGVYFSRAVPDEEFVKIAMARGALHEPDSGTGGNDRRPASAPCRL